jgi:transposase-like protein
LLADRLEIGRENDMSISVPTNCANPKCGQPTIRTIHVSSQKFAIDAVDGAGVFVHHVTYRCTMCGHTWVVQGYSAQENLRPARDQRVATNGNQLSGRGW